MLQISPHVAIPDTEIAIHAMRAQGAGGQNEELESDLTLRRLGTRTARSLAVDRER